MDGPVEEAGKAASSFIDALKAQPLSLALVFMNLALLTYMFYWASVINAARQESIKMILDVEKQVHELLSRCVVPQPGQRSEMGSIPLPTPRPQYLPPDEPVAK